MADHGMVFRRFFYHFFHLFRMADERNSDDIDIFIELADSGLSHAFRRIAKGIGNNINFRDFTQKGLPPLSLPSSQFQEEAGNIGLGNPAFQLEFLFPIHIFKRTYRKAVDFIVNQFLGNGHHVILGFRINHF